MKGQDVTDEVIPPEAVEAAAKWLHDNDCRSAVHSGFPADLECYGWMDEARELLGVAAPHIIAAAWDEGRAHGSRFPYGKRGLATDDNPYMPTK